MGIPKKVRQSQTLAEWYAQFEAFKKAREEIHKKEEEEDKKFIQYVRDLKAEVEELRKANAERCKICTCTCQKGTEVVQQELENTEENTKN